MTLRSLLSAGLLSAGLVLIPQIAAAETADNTPARGSTTFTSRISEVDACNQAQYLMPDDATVQGFKLGSGRDKEGTMFSCSVGWSRDSKATATNRPILFPNTVAIPLIWSGWL